MMTRRLVQLLLASGLILLAVATWQKEALPPKQVMSSDLLNEPEQVQVKQAAFDTTVNGVTYTVQPLYTYDIRGLVVSMHDAKTWWDYLHREWNDHLNVMDLCVVWGNNLRSDNYKEIDYSSGQFICYFNPKSIEAFQAFDQAALSNNHLLTDKPEIARAIRKVRIGDQVRFRGYLAEYSHNHNGQPFKRGTSIVRTDTGNGACETIYIEDFEILKPGGGPWRKLVWLAAFMLVAGVIAWFRLPIDPGIRTALDPEKFKKNI
jgi:hypothetical protein